MKSKVTIAALVMAAMLVSAQEASAYYTNVFWQFTRHENTAFSDADADGVLEYVNDVVKTKNWPSTCTDYACAMHISKSGAVGRFQNVTVDSRVLTLDVINTDEELQAVFNVSGRVKVVTSVLYCGGPVGAGVLGCGQTPGSSFISENTAPDSTFIHEYGHNVGMPDDNTVCAEAIMHQGGDRNTLLAGYCSAFGASDFTNLSGTLTTRTLTIAAGPYRFNNNVVVANGSTVTVQQGLDIQVDRTKTISTTGTGVFRAVGGSVPTRMWGN